MLEQHPEEVQILDEAYREMFLNLYHTFVREAHYPFEPKYTPQIRSEDKYDLRLSALKVACSGAEPAMLVVLKKPARLLVLHLNHFLARRFCEIAILCMLYKMKAQWLWALAALDSHLETAMTVVLKLRTEVPISSLLRMAHAYAFQVSFFRGHIKLAQVLWKFIISSVRAALRLYSYERKNSWREFSTRRRPTSVGLRRSY